MDHPSESSLDGSAMGAVPRGPARRPPGRPSLSHYVAAPVSSIRDETPTSRVLTLDLRGSELVGQYTTPGQYVQMMVDDHPPTFFSIASAPAQATSLEFLIRQKGGPAEALCRLSPGDEVWVSPVAGAGFPMDRIVGGDLLLFATGSGMAPIRAALLHVLPRRDALGAVHLFYGVRDEREVAFMSEIDGWIQAGIDVHLTLSRPGEGWAGLRGYVQHSLERIGPPVEGASVLVCGVDGMVTAVTEALSGRGLPRDHVFKNF